MSKLHTWKTTFGIWKQPLLLPTMSSSMQAYLASKYMSGPKADAILARAPEGTKKKKKRKAAPDATAVAGPSRIQDDDISGFARVDEGEEDPESAAPVVASDRGFKKRKTAGAAADGWATIREGVKEESPAPEDESPQVVEAAQPFKGGLLTNAQLRATLPGKSEKKKVEEAPPDPSAQETVYRDASGRKIDMKAERAEAARKKREREEKEAAKMEWGKGLVQREEAEDHKKQMEKMKTRDFARTVNDKELNELQKMEERWNDPAAAFLTVRFHTPSTNISVLKPVYRKRRQKARDDLNILVPHPLLIGLELSLATDGMVLVRQHL
jgi:pre-mRNA-splicing factor CWC26